MLAGNSLKICLGTFFEISTTLEKPLLTFYLNDTDCTNILIPVPVISMYIRGEVDVFSGIN